MSSIISKLINLAGNITGTLPVLNGGTGVTTSTGTGNTVLSNSPTLVTPLLGTPTSGVLTNCTGYVSPMVGYTGGSAIASGNVGQTILQTLGPTAATSTGASFSVGTYSLAAGVWIALATGAFNNTGVSVNTYCAFDINSASNTTLRAGYSLFVTAAGTQGVQGPIQPLLINSSSSTTITGVGNYDFSTKGSTTVTIYITFLRIA